ncbi:MAG: hypothetical protein JXR83_17815 [Deltaproteobacteria bacterium]|nr:hypothetical protein [Deltaproteobacteria bacterium]
MVDQAERGSGRPFSTAWLAISVLVFCGIELILGGVIGKVIVGRYVSQMLHLKLQLALNLSSYFLGGLLIGLVSPGIRILEPAIGALVSVAMVLAISFFLPYTFMHMGMGNLLIGGGIAFVLALLGARLGEKLVGNLRR